MSIGIAQVPINVLVQDTISNDSITNKEYLFPINKHISTSRIVYCHQEENYIVGRICLNHLVKHDTISHIFIIDKKDSTYFFFYPAYKAKVSSQEIVLNTSSASVYKLTRQGFSLQYQFVCRTFAIVNKNQSGLKFINLDTYFKDNTNCGYINNQTNINDLKRIHGAVIAKKHNYQINPKNKYPLRWRTEFDYFYLLKKFYIID